MDPSSSGFGIFIPTIDWRKYIFLDIRHYGREVNQMFWEIETMLQVSLKGIKLNHTVYEQVPSNANRRYVYEALVRMNGMVRQWKVKIPSIKESIVEGTYPGSWKKHVLDPKKGTNRYKNKRALAEDLCDKFPKMRHHFDKVSGYESTYSYDSFDAAGLLYGTLKEKYTETQIEKPIKGSTYNGYIGVFYKLCDRKVLEEGKVYPDILNRVMSKHDVNLLAYNERYSVLENFTMSATRYPVTLLLIEDEMAALGIRWRFGLGVDPSTVVVATIVRYSLLNNDEQVALFAGKESEIIFQ